MNGQQYMERRKWRLQVEGDREPTDEDVLSALNAYRERKNLEGGTLSDDGKVWSYWCRFKT